MLAACNAHATAINTVTHCCGSGCGLVSPVKVLGHSHGDDREAVLFVQPPDHREQGLISGEEGVALVE
jgi:hypothetical protein